MIEASMFEIVGKVSEVRVIAIHSRIRELKRLEECYGPGRWRKLKGVAKIRLVPEGDLVKAELHWYEAHGVGKKEFKIKKILE
jgi:hypothetical protein